MTCIENFNNWCPVNDADVVGIVAMKWQDEKKENFVSHSFYDENLGEQGYNLRMLALRENLYNLYDNTHEVPLKDEIPEKTEKINGIVESVMELIERM